MKLELMDWKNVEAAAEEQLRNAMVLVRLQTLALEEARKQIKSHGGKSSEDEAAQAKKKANEMR